LQCVRRRIQNWRAWIRRPECGSDLGREQIRSSLKKRYGTATPKDYLLVHQRIQPVTHAAADGKSAKIRVRLFQLSGASGGNGMWIAGLNEIKTTIEDGMDLDYLGTADYKGGRAHVDENAGARKIVAAPFPKIVDPPFPYLNPVSGRRPPFYVP
jgi:hypothetical protein